MKFYSKTVYFTSLIFGLFYFVTIPYTRFLVGVHSLDQIVFGLSLGLWNALTMHFFVRDNLHKGVLNIQYW